MSQPAAESPVETAEDENADKAEEPIKEKESALDPTKRRLELWSHSTSRMVTIQVLPNRVRSLDADHTDHRARERCFRT